MDVRPTVVLLFAGRLRPQFVLLGGAQPIQPMLEVGNALAVEEGFGRSCLIVPRIVHLIYDINRECLVLLMLHGCLLLLRVAFLFVTVGECLVAFATGELLGCLLVLVRLAGGHLMRTRVLHETTIARCQ